MKLLKILYTALIFIVLKLYEILILSFYRFGKWCVGNDQTDWSCDFITYKIKYNILKLLVTIGSGFGIAILYLVVTFVFTWALIRYIFGYGILLIGKSDIDVPSWVSGVSLIIGLILPWVITGIIVKRDVVKEFIKSNWRKAKLMSGLK